MPNYIFNPELEKFHALYAENLREVIEHKATINTFAEKLAKHCTIITTELNSSGNPIHPKRKFDYEYESMYLLDLILRTRTTYSYVWILGFENASGITEIPTPQGLRGWWDFKDRKIMTITNSDLKQIINFTFSRIVDKLASLVKDRAISTSEFSDFSTFFQNSINAGASCVFWFATNYWRKKYHV